MCTAPSSSGPAPTAEGNKGMQYLTATFGPLVALTLITLLATREIVSASMHESVLQWRASLTVAIVPLILTFSVIVAQTVIHTAALTGPMLYSR